MPTAIGVDVGGYETGYFQYYLALEIDARANAQSLDPAALEASLEIDARANAQSLDPAALPIQICIVPKMSFLCELYYKFKETIKHGATEIDNDQIFRYLKTAMTDYRRQLFLAAVKKQEIIDKAHAEMIHGGEITLEPGRTQYPAPDDIIQIIESVTLYFQSVKARVSRWDEHFPKRLPSIRLFDKQLHLDYPLTQQQINLYGHKYCYTYKKHSTAHRITPETFATSPITRIDVLFLRTHAEMMKELILRDAAKPVSIRIGVDASVSDKTDNPTALYVWLMKEFERAMFDEFSQIDAVPLVRHAYRN